MSSARGVPSATTPVATGIQPVCDASVVCWATRVTADTGGDRWGSPIDSSRTIGACEARSGRGMGALVVGGVSTGGGSVGTSGLIPLLPPPQPASKTRSPGIRARMRLMGLSRVGGHADAGKMAPGRATQHDDVKSLGYSLAALVGSYPGRVMAAVVFTEEPGRAGHRLGGERMCTASGRAAQLAGSLARACARAREGRGYPCVVDSGCRRAAKPLSAGRPPP